MLFNYLETIASHGTASQSSVYYCGGANTYLTADLAITGGPTHDFNSISCTTTIPTPVQYAAWLTFPVDTVYITIVKIYYREYSKFYFSFVFFNLISSPYSCNEPLCCNDILTVSIIDDLSKG